MKPLNCGGEHGCVSHNPVPLIPTPYLPPTPLSPMEHYENPKEPNSEEVTLYMTFWVAERMYNQETEI